MLTVFTSAVYPDLARLWYACVIRAFPPDTTSFEIFDDSGGTLDASWFPRATILPRTDSRRDFQESYNDAIWRAKTPFLAFIDTDIFWTSSGVWMELHPYLQRPSLAAIACISRRHRPSHGTFAVVLNVRKYRSVMNSLPDGFLPMNVRFGPNVPMDDWFGYDTGDRITHAVREAGYEVQLRQQAEGGPLVCFESVTMYRRTAEHVEEHSLASMARNSNWLWRGCICSLVLERLHNRLYPATKIHSHRSAGAFGMLMGMGSRWPRGLRFTASCLRAAGQVERFLLSAPPH
jgi:hypothetical protein